MQLPRGIRNNNPGNIVRNAIQWKGMAPVQFDRRFVTFAAPVWGLRALMKTLLTYYRKHGLDTPASIINRWAPPHENATDYYIWHVAHVLRMDRFDQINVAEPEILTGLAKAIVLHENGWPPRSKPKNWYSKSIYTQALEKSLQM